MNMTPELRQARDALILQDLAEPGELVHQHDPSVFSEPYECCGLIKDRNLIAYTKGHGTQWFWSSQD